MLLQVSQLGNPILRNKPKKVEDVGDKEIQEVYLKTHFRSQS